MQLSNFNNQKFLEMLEASNRLERLRRKSELTMQETEEVKNLSQILGLII
jgi:hypothetical protein